MYFKQYLGPISTYSNSQVLYRFAYYKKKIIITLNYQILNRSPAYYPQLKPY